MRYEEVAGLLLRAAHQTGLHLYAIHSTLETAELDRRFSVRCLPEKWPKELRLVAELSFEWDSALTSYTIMGTDRLCSLYHPLTEQCPHQDGWAMPSIDLTAVFELPVERAQEVPVGAPLGRLGLRVQRLLIEAGVSGELLPPVFEVVVQEKGTLEVRSWHQPVRWHLGDDLLEDSEELGSALEGICHQIYQGLQRLRESLVESEAHTEEA
ncbi:MAG: hypothetical protein ACP5SI_09110 [Chloroflexia bacterium]